MKFKGKKFKGYQTKNIKDLKLKGYEYTASLDQDLFRKHLVAFGLTSQPEICPKIEGEYTIEWDDDIPNVYVTSIFISNPYDSKSYIEVDLNSFVELFDLEALGAMIYDNADQGNWYEDKAANAMDYDWDMER